MQVSKQLTDVEKSKADKKTASALETLSKSVTQMSSKSTETKKMLETIRQKVDKLPVNTSFERHLFIIFSMFCFRT